MKTIKGLTFKEFTQDERKLAASLNVKIDGFWYSATINNYNANIKTTFTYEISAWDSATRTIKTERLEKYLSDKEWYFNQMWEVKY